VVLLALRQCAAAARQALDPKIAGLPRLGSGQAHPARAPTMHPLEEGVFVLGSESGIALPSTGSASCDRLRMLRAPSDRCIPWRKRLCLVEQNVIG
jgi:hypothetical protein